LSQDYSIHYSKGSPLRKGFHLSKEDRLFAAPYVDAIVSNEVTSHCLNLDDEDLWDDVIGVLAGCDCPELVIADQLQGVDTVGHLVTALAKVASHPITR
jgi:hypothetical protein